MAYENVHNDVRKCINLQIPTRVPCFPLGLDFDIQSSGFTHRQFRENPEVMVKVGKTVIEKYDYDWFILHPDDLVEYENIGIGIKYEENKPPGVYEYLPTDKSTLNRLSRYSLYPEKGRTGIYLEGLRGLKEELGNSIYITGRIAAPFSSVALILGIEGTLILMLEKPELLKQYMEFFLEYNDIFAKAQLEAGADAIWLGDCVATSHFISPQHYQDFAAEYAKRSCDLIQKRGGIVFYHGCEKSLPHLRIMAELGFSAINIGEGVDIGKVKKEIGDKVCIMGNLDTINVLTQKSEVEVENEVGTIVKKGKAGGGYIFCTGEGITSITPEENVRAMIRGVRKYGKY